MVFSLVPPHPVLGSITARAIGGASSSYPWIDCSLPKSSSHGQGERSPCVSPSCAPWRLVNAHHHQIQRSYVPFQELFPAGHVRYVLRVTTYLSSGGIIQLGSEAYDGSPSPWLQCLLLAALYPRTIPSQEPMGHLIEESYNRVAVHHHQYTHLFHLGSNTYQPPPHTHGIAVIWILSQFPMLQKKKKTPHDICLLSTSS